MKYKRRFLPIEPYEVDALESWLSDCSAEGLFLEKLNTIFATFAQKEPHRMVYRLIPKKDKDSYIPERQEAALYEEPGWKFIASLSRYFFIYAAEEGTAEIYTDPIEESKQYTLFAGKEETPAKKFALSALSMAMFVFYIWWEREANLVSSRFTIGAPVQLSYNQAGMVTGKTDAYGDPYQPVLWVHYYRFSPLVTAKEYIDSYLSLLWHSTWENEVLTDTPFDYAVLSKQKDCSTLFLVFEDALLELSYSYGDADLTKYYHLYLQALQEYHKT